MNRIEELHPERIVPSETEAGILSIHLKRYDFALPYCQGKTVLDVACGVGYGSAYLAKAATHVVGVEIDAEALEYATRHYALSNVEFLTMDATRLEFDDASFDVICSFETIEHLREIERYLAEVARTLKEDGIYIVSTPHVWKTNRKPENPFHTIEYSRRDFETLLKKHFREIDIYGQRRKQSLLHYLLQKLDFLKLRAKVVPAFLVRRSSRALGITPITDLSLNDILITKDRMFMATEMVAVCRVPQKK